MPPPATRTTTILFADLVGSTDLRSRTGERAGDEREKAHAEIVRHAAEACDGVVIKSIGDGAMVTFDAASDAIRAAVDVQRRSAAQSGSGDSVRVGIAVGDVVWEGNDCRGLPVVEAARLQDAAGPGEIRVSELARLLAGARSGFRYGVPTSLNLKGFNQERVSCVVEWQRSSTAAPATRRARVGKHDVLRARFRSPRLPPAAIDRPELERRLVDGLKRRVVSVLAPAGFGKSTLVAQAIAATPLPAVWCSCDERLGDARAIVAHLVGAIEEKVPGFGAELEIHGDADRLARALSNEALATLAADLVVALDDVHLLPDQSRDALAAVIRDAPVGLHFVLSGRFDTGILRRASVRPGELLELGEDDLRVDDADAARLFDRLGAETADVARLAARVDGWMAGLVLAAQTRHEAGAHERGGADIHRYLLEDVLDEIDASSRDLLVRTSPLERMSAGIAVAATGNARAGEILDGLVARNLLTGSFVEDDDTWFRYHAALRDALRAELELRGRASRLTAVRRCADALVAAGRPVEAAPLYLDADAIDRAADALSPHAEAMARGPRWKELSGLLDRMPDDVIADRPELLLAQAILRPIETRFDDAFPATRRAAEALVAHGDHARASEALVAHLAFEHLSWGIFSRSDIDDDEALIASISPSEPSLAYARAFLAIKYANASRFGDAEHQLELAVVGDPPPNLEAFAEAVRGFFIERLQGRMDDCIRRLERASRHFLTSDSSDPLAIGVLTLAYRSLALIFIGRYEDGLESITATSERGDQRWLSGLTSSSIQLFAAAAHLGLGRVKTAREQWSDAAARMATSVPFAIAARAALELAEGRRNDALASVREVRKMTAGQPPQAVLIGAQCDAAVVAYRAGDPALAREVAELGLDPSKTLGLGWHHARLVMVSALTRLDSDDAGPELGLSLELIRGGGWEHLLTHRDRAVAAPLLATATVGDHGPPGYAAELAARCGGEVFEEYVRLLKNAPAAARAEAAAVAERARDVRGEVVRRLLADPDPGLRESARRGVRALRSRGRGVLRFHTMGSFGLWRDGRRLPAEVFDHPGSPEAIAALLFAGGALAPDALAERLAMGRADIDEIVDGVDRIFGSVDLDEGSILRAADGRLALRLTPEDEWDLAEFRTLAEHSLDDDPPALDRLLEAESAYGGELLPEWSNRLWVIEAEDRLRSTASRLFARSAEVLTAAGRHIDAARRFGRLLELEPTRWSWHVALMRAHADAGEPARALRQYQRLKVSQAAHGEIVEVPEAEALYADLISTVS